MQKIVFVFAVFKKIYLKFLISLYNVTNGDSNWLNEMKYFLKKPPFNLKGCNEATNGDKKERSYVLKSILKIRPHHVLKTSLYHIKLIEHFSLRLQNYTSQQ